MDNDDKFEVFDFVVNDEDEVMLLMYVREGEPDKPFVLLHPDEGTAILHRNNNDEIFLSDIWADIFDSLADADKLLVCELSRTDNEDDTEIVHAYEADIED